MPCILRCSRYSQSLEIEDALLQTGAYARVWKGRVPRLPVQNSVKFFSDFFST